MELSTFPTWCNTIAVECFGVWELLAIPDSLFSSFSSLFSSPEPTTPLLIHLCSRCYTIYSHKEDLLRLNFAKKMVDVCKDCGEDLRLGEAEVCVFIVWMRAYIMTTRVSLRL